MVCASKGQKIFSRVIEGQTVHPDNEDWALAQYRLKSGAMVSHQISWEQKWHCNRYTMEIHGSQGSIYLRTGYGPLAVTSPGVSQAGSRTFPALDVVPFGYRQHREVIEMCIRDRGYMILAGRQFMRVNLIMVGMLTIGVIGLILFALLNWLEKIVLKWRQ